MGEMADRRGDAVMLPVVKDKRYGAKGTDKPGKFFYLPFCHLGGRRQDIVGIFQEGGFGVGKADPLASRHGMSADEASGKPFPFGQLMDGGFDAPNVRQDGALPQIFFQKRKVFVVVGHRGTEKNIIGVAEERAACFIKGSKGPVRDPFLLRLFKRRFLNIAGQDTRFRPGLPERPRDGAADQPEPVKGTG